MSDRKPKNILFIMYDQLRWDYLSCYGHPTLKTPNMDRLAAMGVRFNQAFVQSPVCGAARMSAYTGRYVSSHGAAWNGFPLKVGEITLGDHLRALGSDCVLIGKTHMRADKAGMDRLGIQADSIIGARLSECGFDVWVREDGMVPIGPDGPYDDLPGAYNQSLKAKDYPGDNPWHDYANSSVDDAGNVASGWVLLNCDKPANIKNEDSETPWLTGEALRFLDDRVATGNDAPWCAHLSFIKPHWPYVVPKPYHGLYGPADVKPAIRSDAERDSDHPIYRQFANNGIAKAFQRDDVRDAVIPSYMALIKQADDELGRLLDELDARGLMDSTMIVLTSDHGDYLGDHWMGEKDLFHDCSVRVPLIIYDPDPSADATRGSVNDDLVEQIDLVATFSEINGGEDLEHILEGRSLLPLLRDGGNTPADWRSYAISEYDYSMSGNRPALGVALEDARLFMVATHRWKFMHSEGEINGEPIRPMLFDREGDPDELVDLGADPDYAEVIEQMYTCLFDWAMRCDQRTTLSHKTILAKTGASRRRGILLGMADGSEFSDEHKVAISGRTAEVRGGR